MIFQITFRAFAAVPLRRKAFLSISVFAIATILIPLYVSAQVGTIDQTFRPGLEQLGGEILVLEPQPDGKVIVGGLFQFVETGTRINIARLNADGSHDLSFDPGEGANASIQAIAVQPDGKIIVGGYFTTFNRQAAVRIVRLNSDGSIDPTFTATGPSGAPPTGVLAIALQPDGKIIVGGSFATFAGQPANHLVRLNANGSVDATFDSSSAGFAGRVTHLNITPAGKVYAGNNFFVQGVERSNIRRLNSDGSLDGGFSAELIPGGLYSAALQPDGRILVGAFVPAGMTATSLFRLLDTGAPDPSFTATSNAKVHSIIVEPDGKITIGGEFQLWNDTARERLARLNSDGSLDGTFVNNTPFPYPVRTLAKLKDGKLMVGGSSASFTDTNPSRLTRHNSNGTLDTSFTTKVKIPSSAEMVRVQPDGKIIVGGTFWYVNGSERKYIARLHTSGTLDTSFAAEPDGAVLAVAFQSDGKILVGGRFATVNGVNRSRIARLNADGSLDTSFDPGAGIGGGFPTSASVHAIVPLADGKFLLGGSFLTYNDTSRRGIVRINANGSLDTSFDSGGVTGGSEIVSNVIPQPDGKILIGGNFVFIGGVRRIGIARLGVNGALDTSFSSDPGLNNSVHAAALQPDGKVLIGGIFDVVHGATRNNFARLTSDGFRDDTLNVGTGFSGGAGFSYVTAIDLQSDGKILVAGNFTFYNGTSANYLIRLNTDGSVDPGFDIGAGPNLRINSLARLANGDVVIAGLFTYVQGYFHSAIARIKMGGRSAPFDFDGDGKTDVGIFRPSAAEWWIYRSGSGSVFAAQFGATTDKIVPADFTGDGKTDVAFWRPSTGEWFVVRSEDGTYFAAPFGAASDIPVPADYDGDGKADVAVFRPSDGNWYIRRSSDGVTTAQLFGQNGDQPIPADYDGDGKTDVAIYRPSVSEWWIYRSTAGVIAYSFGTATDKTVPADYTGDGKADVAFWRPSTGEWVILRSEDTTYYSAPFGASSDLPTTGDYDGDGKVDLAVFRPSNGTWFVNRTSGGTSAQQFGANGDQPLSGAFVR